MSFLDRQLSLHPTDSLSICEELIDSTSKDIPFYQKKTGAKKMRLNLKANELECNQSETKC